MEVQFREPGLRSVKFVSTMEPSESKTNPDLASTFQPLSVPMEKELQSLDLVRRGATTAASSLMGTVAATQTHQISVCICTFKRPDFLSRLLAKLDHQQTEGLFAYSVVVADNDSTRSAEQVVAAFSSTTRLPVTYCVEPQQNIALARNKALQHAVGDLVAFIDDDEFPADNWLRNLFQTYIEYGVDGVLGPVKPFFEFDPPRWAQKGRFFERPTYTTGYKVSWAESRTGNVLFRRSILNGEDMPFRSQFDTAGEDVDFFRRMMEKGCSFAWCDEAVAYEVVPPSRCSRTYLLKRALLRGSNFPKQSRHRFRNLAKSLIAVPCYTLILPALLLFGQHVFLTYLIKLLDHASRLLAFCGLKLVTQRKI
jgi:succinoglycan biosynthesis protein ExoM